MKKAVLSSVLMVLCILALAQAPESFNYQVVVRDGSTNSPLTDQNVSFRMSILKGSSSGESQYSELHSANTGALGIVNLVIGNGTGKTGNITTIDWGADTYYLKVEIDKTGGSSYVEMGTTQLLSVPYAMYAKTVASYNETDPAVTSNFNFAGAAINDLLNFNGIKWVKFTPNFALTTHTHDNATATTNGFLSSTDWTIFNGKEAPLTFDTPLSRLDNAISIPLATTTTPGSMSAADKTKLDGIAIPTHTIGESYGGGKVFFVYDNGQHGLIAATADQSTGIRWYAGTYSWTLAWADGALAGKANTTVINASQGAGDGLPYASIICTIYSVTVGGVTYGDWYLPSKAELNLLYLQKAVVGGFTNNYYWSSTEGGDAAAWNQSFGNGYQCINGKSAAIYVRAIRAF